MRLSTRLLAALLLLSHLPAAVGAQIPPKNVVLAKVASNRVLVANPVLGAPAGAGPVLEIGQGLRGELARIVAGRYQVISRDGMNTALRQFGYQPDASLDQATAGALATSFRAVFFVTATLADEGQGRFKVIARLARTGEGSGTEVNLAQAEGQTPEAFGAAIARALKPSIP
jgi:hypothetical protein